MKKIFNFNLNVTHIFDLYEELSHDKYKDLLLFFKNYYKRENFNEKTLAYKIYRYLLKKKFKKILFQYKMFAFCIIIIAFVVLLYFKDMKFILFLEPLLIIFILNLNSFFAPSPQKPYCEIKKYIEAELLDLLEKNITKENKIKDKKLHYKIISLLYQYNIKIPEHIIRNTSVLKI